MRAEGPPLPDRGQLRWIGDIPARWARERPDKPAIVLPEARRKTTYRQLAAWTQRFVEVIRARGLQEGDRIAYLGKNSDLYFVALFGAILGKFVLLPLNWRCAVPELAFMVGDAQARLVIADEEFAPAVRAMSADSSTGNVDIIRTEGAGSLREALQTPCAQNLRVPHEPKQICLLMYTSGTTGRPKGVILTHAALSHARHSELVSSDWESWDEQDVTLSPLPNFHIGGTGWALIGLIRGLTCVQAIDSSPEHLLELIEEYAVTRMFIVPTLVANMLAHLRSTGRRPPRVRTVTYGAAVMSQGLLQEAMSVLGCEFGQYYGMTEACGTVTYLASTDHDVKRPYLLKSVGKPQCGMAVEIRDVTGAVLKAGQKGEIWVRTPTLMAGYWNLPEASRTAIIHGWYRTGDGGYLDPEGYLYLTDRIRDMIITGGENVYPAEVEEILRKHPAVRDAVVVGAPDDQWGERVIAVVERREGFDAGTEELRAFVKQHLAGYKCPKAVIFVDALPRNAMGKVPRSLVRASMEHLQSA